MESVSALSSNCIKIHICFSEMKKKKYKEEKMKEIVRTICALLNSHGGTVTMEFKAATENDVQNLKRAIEQRLSDILGFSSMRDHINLVSLRTDGCVFIVKGVSSLCTMNYNLYVPSETQVLVVPPKTHNISDIKQILSSEKRIFEVGELVEIKTHHKDFVSQQRMTDGLPESKTTQLKCLKAEKSKCVTLGDRMTNKANKFANYVSAFANHLGGHIYYGVEDDGVVKGECVKDKEEITKKVSKAINKMVWPLIYKAEKGTQWDIFFEPVKNKEGQFILSTYVIVVYISFCVGGVFTEEPKSYHIVDGAVEKIGFQEWKERFLCDQTPLPLAVQHGTFSSERNQKFFYTIMEKMMDLRNTGKNETFEKYISFLKEERSDDINVQLATLSQQITVTFRRNKFSKANELIEKYDDLNQKSKENTLVPESMGLYIKSANLRAQGEFRESYELANLGLQRVQRFSPGLIQAWFYTHTAMLANIIAGDDKKGDPETRRRFVVEAKFFFEKALDYSNAVVGFDIAVKDLQQKVYIQLAFVYLGSSLNGSMVSAESVSNDDVTSAKNCLMMVAKLIDEGYPLSPLRKVQYLMARSSLSAILSYLNQTMTYSEPICNILYSYVKRH